MQNKFNNIFALFSSHFAVAARGEVPNVREFHPAGAIYRPYFRSPGAFPKRATPVAVEFNVTFTTTATVAAAASVLVVVVVRYLHAFPDQLCGTMLASALIFTNPERYHNSISTTFSTHGPTETHATRREKANFPKKVYFPIHTTWWYALGAMCECAWMGNWINFTLARRTILMGLTFSRAEFVR